jgi:hypothetical protein
LQEVKHQIEQMRGELEALSSAIWQDIDHENQARLDEGVRFKQSYNERRSALQETMDKMLALLTEYPTRDSGSFTGKSPEKTPQAALEMAAAESGATVTDKSETAASSAGSGLEQKVPFGFILGGKTYTSASSWTLFYEALLQELYGRAPEKIAHLAEARDGFGQKGRPLFARVPDSFDEPLPIADSIFAEADIAPQALIEVIRRLIRYMGYPMDSFKILLKEKNRGTVETLSIAA